SQSLDDLNSWLPGYETGHVDPRDEIYREPEGSYWYGDLHDVDQCIPTFNCVTYAVGEIAGLTIADYVPTSAGDATEGTNPVRVILESYYVRRESWDPTLRPWSEFENDPNYAEGDVVCLVNENRQDFVHMARVSKVEGKNRLVGKLGAGPVVRTSPGTIATMYQGKFDRVEVYRRK
ncbi:MAG TPA: hypothetical protein VLA12_01890, partial [Planctomycetaceae bacterium]|nr:hypothetical protein [Planctomycetaceae bacterium]